MAKEKKMYERISKHIYKTKKALKSINQRKYIEMHICVYIH